MEWDPNWRGPPRNKRPFFVICHICFPPSSFSTIWFFFGWGTAKLRASLFRLLEMKLFNENFEIFDELSLLPPSLFSQSHSQMHKCKSPQISSFSLCRSRSLQRRWSLGGTNMSRTLPLSSASANHRKALVATSGSGTVSSRGIRRMSCCCRSLFWVEAWFLSRPFHRSSRDDGSPGMDQMFGRPKHPNWFGWLDLAGNSHDIHPPSHPTDI